MQRTNLSERERRDFRALTPPQQRAYRHLRESGMEHAHALGHARRPAATAPGTAGAAKQRIVIDLYDHTGNSEIADILDDLARIGFSNDPRLERDAGSGWRTIDRREINAMSDR